MLESGKKIEGKGLVSTESGSLGVYQLSARTPQNSRRGCPAGECVVTVGGAEGRRKVDRVGAFGDRGARHEGTSGGVRRT